MSDAAFNRDIVNKVLFPRGTKFLDKQEQVIANYIVGDYAPDSPPIAIDAAIACVGSCFAEEMAKSLAAQGRNVAPVFLSERWSSAFAVSHFLDFAFEGTPVPDGFIPKGVDASHLNSLHGSLDKAEAIIITLGLSLCWFDMTTDSMVLDVPGVMALKGLSKALPRYTMKQTGVGENVEAIAGIIHKIRWHKPTAPIILTVSPVPLYLAVTDSPVIPANNISKAALRMAVFEFMRCRPEGVYYWPSYDIVEWLAKYDGPRFGIGGEDLRHIDPAAVSLIMSLFSKYYFREN